MVMENMITNVEKVGVTPYVFKDVDVTVFIVKQDKRISFGKNLVEAQLPFGQENI